MNSASAKQHSAFKVLWLGAHKTGTTFLQRCLDRSQPALCSARIRYMELDEFRDKYGRPLLNNDFANLALNEFDGTDETMLIFDENIPGYVQHALSPRGFYPDMEARATTITDYLDFEPTDVVFGVRSYEGFLPSLYCETLKSTPFQTFDNYLRSSFRTRWKSQSETGPEIADLGRMSWPKLLRRLRRLYPHARVRIYFYEQLRGNEVRLLSEVLGLPADQIELLDTVERAGFSNRAVRRLHKISEKRAVEPRDVLRVNRHFPSGPDFPSFSPFDDAERAELRQRYRAECDDLRSDDRFDVIDLG